MNTIYRCALCLEVLEQLSNDYYRHSSVPLLGNITVQNGKQRKEIRGGEETALCYYEFRQEPLSQNTLNFSIFAETTESFTTWLLPPYFYTSFVKFYK